MKIGYRTIKTAIGTPIAIWIAELLSLTNFASAGILTILCIQNTRKRSVTSASSRFLACMLAMGLSYLFFEFLGYQPYIIGLMLLVFIPATVKLKIQEGIVTSSVIILHLYGASTITVSTLLNEFMLIVVGIGVAVLFNVYMPSLEGDLHTKQKQIEANFSKILKEIAAFLRTGDLQWTGTEITQTADLLEKAKSIAFKDVENHLLRNHHPYYHYFQMRQKQFELLEGMLALITRVPSANQQSMIMADFFEELSDSVHPGNTAVLFLEQIRDMKETFRETELPKSREEFETRATLFSLLNTIEQYLIIKRLFKKSDI